MKPAPVIVSAGVAGISSGISAIPFMVDYLGIATGSENKFTEKQFVTSLSYPFVTGQEVDKTRQEYGLPSDEILLYSHSHLNRLSEDFLASMASILKASEKCTFVFSGRGEPGAVLRYFDSKGLRDRVKFLESLLEREDRLPVIKLTDIYVNPFPFSLPEDTYYAMLNSKPVITLRPEPKDIFMNKAGAAFVDNAKCIAESLDDYVEKTLAFINSEELRMTIGENLQQRAKTDLCFDSFINQLQEKYIELHETYSRN
jgi:predicted O-linked N-acetylglucosamine transferase (SPINDLY family)